MKKNNNVNVYGINIKTNPKEMVRLSNQLNYERYLFKKNVRTFESKDKYIINAETGFKYEDNFIGSNDEKKFFKVFRSELLEGEKRYTPKILFYNSKEEYEEHLKKN